METPVDKDFKCFDETFAIINSTVSSTLPPGLPKELCEVDSKAWFVKTEAASPVQDTTEVDQHPAGLQLEHEPSLKMLIKTEASSPQHVEEESPPGLPKELCEVDSKAWFVKTEPASPVQDTTEVDQHPAGLQSECEPSLKMPIKTEASSPQHVEEHEEESPPGSDRSMQSSNCPHTAQLQSHLQIHTHSVHKASDAAQCPHCEYSTSIVGNLQRHIRVHNKMRKSQCPHCDYTNNRKSALRNHIDAVHKKRWAFQCPHCEYKCSKKSILMRHIDSVHNNIWAFQCPLCKYKCSHKSILSQHIDSVHKKIKSFQCPYCEHTTNWKSAFKNHIDAVHKKIKAFQCVHCEYKTNWKHHLNRHIKSLHERRCFVKLQVFVSPNFLP